MYDCEKLVAESREKQLVAEYIFTDATKDINKTTKLLREFFKNYQECLKKHLITIEPKVINDPHEVLRNIFAMAAVNIFVGEESGHNEELLELFKNLVGSIVKAFFAPKTFSFIHPSLHDQLATFSLRFMSKYKRAIVKHIKLIVKKTVS
ncbi:hypothetical protein C2G38_2140506 [Gigaspora rosea]|uniref:Uncharacterized protein n=1 Tax=Gigaspora rosea TaxID=44941 RepID=A0A397VIF7_9GLOM|nr:hypothetical protein C2G38_2140506 [Gigaspora rosea]